MGCDLDDSRQTSSDRGRRPRFKEVELWNSLVCGAETARSAIRIAVIPVHVRSVDQNRRISTVAKSVEITIGVDPIVLSLNLGKVECHGDSKLVCGR